ncbi:uncharacterized protein N7459_000477 [Penicillium hispanicum]|uniref:uncharacterized protein n=1 Tax=Penicillium hispanicum TaxID=1080232 RepID=UPI002541B527|nr:uncharacterized protein N7459_000477 [Penicillium hispanicum]KAJ5594269.1 hypothetical protein N7459_000477 [Penicillium hispanicum]
MNWSGDPKPPLSQRILLRPGRNLGSHLQFFSFAVMAARLLRHGEAPHGVSGTIDEMGLPPHCSGFHHPRPIGVSVYDASGIDVYPVPRSALLKTLAIGPLLSSSGNRWADLVFTSSAMPSYWIASAT